MTQSKSILEEAEALINGTRQQTYGSPAWNFQNIADVTRVLMRARYEVDIPLTADFMALVMAVAVKGCRLANPACAKHRDTMVDGAGYFGLIELIQKEQK